MELDSDRELYSVNLVVNTSFRELNVKLIEFNNPGPELELQVSSALRFAPVAQLKNARLQQYTLNLPIVRHLGVGMDSQVYLYFLSNSGQDIMMMTLYGPDDLQITWQHRLQSPLAYVEFANATGFENFDRQSLIIGPVILQSTKVSAPNEILCDLSNNFINGDTCSGNVLTCEIANGNGEQLWLGDRFADCQVVSCDGGYHENENRCDLDVIACPIANGRGEITWLGTQYSGCVVAACNSGYHSYLNQCDPDVIACTDGSPGAVGEIRWNGTAYDPCTIVSCSQAGTHLENGTCLSNTRSCPITNGVGQQIWNGTNNNYDACTIVRCDQYYSQVGSQCNLLLDGSRSHFVQVSGYNEAGIRSACEAFPHTQAVGCVSGEARTAESAAAIDFIYGTYGGYNSLGTHVVFGNETIHFCYRPGQKRDNDGSDRVVGIKCSNVPNATLNY